MRGLNDALNNNSESSAIEITGLWYQYERRASVVEDINLTVESGSCVAIVGPSGCGKTTILNIVAGIEVASQGSVRVRGTMPSCGRSDVGYMMARDGLLAWRTALQNVALPLEVKGIQRSKREALARHHLREVGLLEYADKYRAELSHGMRQRVALARTLVTEPSIILLDEPFSALDAQTRLRLQTEFCRLTERRNVTSLVITHDIAEGVALADTVVVLSKKPGRIKATVPIVLPRPRVPADLQGEDRYHELLEVIWEYLKPEVELHEGL